MRFSPSKASALVAALASSTFLAQEVDAAAINAGNTAKLPLCSTVNNSPQYDYIVGQYSSAHRHVEVTQH